jgi:hypothetical protein
MRINNSKHVPWIIFVLLATIAACILYVGNFHPAALPAWIPLPPSLIQQTTEHHTVGGTPLGLWFGTISLGIFLFAVLLSLRKKIPLWRVGTVQRWLRAHIWLTVLTIPLVILHSGFLFGGAMTTFLLGLYAVVMVSGFYGLFLQHLMPRLMKARLPAETVYEQIPHIRAQLATAATKMRDSFKPAAPKKLDAGAPASSATKTVTAPAAAMASTKTGIETPAARAKSATGSAPTAVPVTEAPLAATAPAKAETLPTPVSIPNATVNPAPPKVETIGTPTARVQSDPAGAPVARTEVPAGDQAAPSPPVAPAAAAAVPAPASPSAPAVAAAPKPAAPVAKPATPPKPAPKPAPPPDPESEEILVEFIERQILPYLQARRGDRMRLNNLRFSDDTFRYVKLRVAEGYRSRVEEIQTWCDERRMLDVQVRLHHWLHGWLFVHVPFSFLLVMVTIWHAFVTLFYY